MVDFVPLTEGQLECKVHFSTSPIYALRSRTPWDLRKNKKYYFEVTIKKEVDSVGIGLVHQEFPFLERMPGEYTVSVGETVLSVEETGCLVVVFVF